VRRGGERKKGIEGFCRIGGERKREDLFPLASVDRGGKRGIKKGVQERTKRGGEGKRFAKKVTPSHVGPGRSWAKRCTRTPRHEKDVPRKHK